MLRHGCVRCAMVLLGGELHQMEPVGQGIRRAADRFVAGGTPCSDGILLPKHGEAGGVGQDALPCDALLAWGGGDLHVENVGNQLNRWLEILLGEGWDGKACALYHPFVFQVVVDPFELHQALLAGRGVDAGRIIQ